LSDVYDLEMTTAVRSPEGWRVAAATPDFERVSAFAVASEEPGIHRLFAALAGYVFYPLPPTHGAHTLILNRVIDAGITGADQLVGFMDHHVFGDERHVIEFEISNGQLADERLMRTYSIPDDRGSNLETFISTIATARVSAETDLFDD
jgi:hypothetical protein